MCITVNTVSLEKCHCVESLWSKNVCKHFLRERWGAFGWAVEVVRVPCLLHNISSQSSLVREIKGEVSIMKIE